MDNFKVGGGAVPIKTVKVWLNLCHGATKTCSHMVHLLAARCTI